MNLEIVDQGELDQLGRKSRALRIDELAFEFLREQHRPQFLAHLSRNSAPIRGHSRPMILIRSTSTPCCQFSSKCPRLPLGEDISISRPFESASIGSSAACIASLTKAASSLMIGFGAE